MSNSLGGKCYVKQIEEDLLIEPKDICDINTRRACDSYYIHINKKLRKDIKKLMIENINLRYKLQEIKELVVCERVDEEKRERIIKIIYEEN